MCVDFLIERFRERPREPAVVSPAGRCSFGELADLTKRWSDTLARDRLAAGTAVGLEGDFSPNAIALFLALTDRAAIVVPHRSGSVDSARRSAIAQVETTVRVESDDAVRVEPTGRIASHELYDELRRRNHPGLVQFSSGTTGEPKAAVHDLTPLLAKFETRRPALSAIAFLLFDHMGGINTMLQVLSSGATLVATADRKPEAICGLIERHRVELLPATPTFLNLLMLSGAHRRHDLASLRAISYGAEPMPETVLQRLRKAFPGVRLRQTYGMVELGVMRTRPRDGDSLWIGVGGEGFQTRVVDGMLEVKARSMLLGYLNAEAPMTADGWFKTGDAVEQDGEYLKFLGRKSDLINVGGEKVFPVEVEGVIESVDGVVEASVYGERNGLVGEIVCARVTAPGVGDEARFRRLVKRVCGERLERFKVPVRIEVVGERLEAGVKKSRRVGAEARP